MTFEELCNSRMVVHHRNNIPYFNHPENLEVMDLSDHLSLHSGKDYRPEAV